uniref:Uncharacterized protein n=1 Tax=Zooxanthella nutricula TaxID=1333877 RepID=A0A7S2PVT2_9DINO
MALQSPPPLSASPAAAEAAAAKRSRQDEVCGACFAAPGAGCPTGEVAEPAPKARKTGTTPDDAESSASDAPAGPAVCTPTAEAAMLPRHHVGTPPTTLASLLAVRPQGPPDFGGQLIDYLWGVRMVYSAPIEYLLLLCFGRSQEAKEDSKPLGAQKIVAPEICALLRCSRSTRRGAIAAAEARRRVLEPHASAEARRRLQEICNEVKDRYPKSWTVARQSWGFLDCSARAGTMTAMVVA